jgi:hypothetical protein
VNWAFPVNAWEVPDLGERNKNCWLGTANWHPGPGQPTSHTTKRCLQLSQVNLLISDLRILNNPVQLWALTVPVQEKAFVLINWVKFLALPSMGGAAQPALLCTKKNSPGASYQAWAQPVKNYSLSQIENTVENWRKWQLWHRCRMHEVCESGTLLRCWWHTCLRWSTRESWNFGTLNP